MKKALFISMHSLDAFTGGSMASRNFLKIVLSVFDGAVSVVAAAESAEMAEKLGVTEFHPVPKRTQLQKATYLIRAVCRDRFTPYCERHFSELLEGMTHVVIDGSMIGRFAPMIKRMAPSVHVTQLHHNFERKFFADSIVHWAVKPFIRKIIDRNQGEGWHASDLNLTFTEQDQMDLLEAYGNPSVGRAEVFGYYEDCGDMPAIVTRGQASRSRVRMIITGNMSVPKGYEGAVWFVQDVLPALDAAEYELVIAGRDPHPNLVDACQAVPSVTLIPNPVDMEVLLKDANIFVNPSSIGSGIKVRNFDGLRSGLPVICHAGNAYGFEHMAPEVFSAFEDAATFRAHYEAVVLASDERDLCLEVRTYYEQNCSIERGAVYLQELIGAGK